MLINLNIYFDFKRLLENCTDEWLKIYEYILRRFRKLPRRHRIIIANHKIEIFYMEIVVTKSFIPIKEESVRNYISKCLKYNMIDYLNGKHIAIHGKGAHRTVFFEKDMFRPKAAVL